MESSPKSITNALIYAQIEDIKNNWRRLKHHYEIRIISLTGGIAVVPTESKLFYCYKMQTNGKQLKRNEITFIHHLW